MKRTASRTDFRVWPKNSKAYICPTQWDICYGGGETEGMLCGCPKHRPDVWEKLDNGSYSLLPHWKRGFRNLQ